MACKKKNSSRIAIVRGDSAYIKLTITDGEGNPFPFVIGEDKIRCQVRDEVNDGELLFEGDVFSTERIEDGITQLVHYITLIINYKLHHFPKNDVDKQFDDVIKKHKTFCR